MGFHEQDQYQLVGTGWLDWFCLSIVLAKLYSTFCWRMIKYHKTFLSGLCEKTPPLLSRSSEGVSEHGFFATENIQVNVISQTKKTTKILRNRARTTTPPRKWTYFIIIYPDVFEVYLSHGVTSAMFPKSGMQVLMYSSDANIAGMRLLAQLLSESSALTFARPWSLVTHHRWRCFIRVISFHPFHHF